LPDSHLYFPNAVVFAPMKSEVKTCCKANHLFFNCLIRH
jgi:hypothetical protein